MIIWLLIFVSIIIFVVIWKNRRITEPFYPYGMIDDDISSGNLISLSGNPNPYVNINQIGRQDSIVYQAHGIPLVHEDHPTTPVENSMFYFTNYSCHPECCLYSPFSCTNGCVCWEAHPQPHFDQNVKITPRS